MTVDEIFSSESEHLYFRLIAARNALNAANDSDTIQVLNDILDETLNNIDRIGTDEEIAAAEEIVVRKSNKTVKDYITSQRFALIATAVMFVTAVGAALALLLIIIGSSDKVKPIVTVVIVAALIIAGALFVSKYMKKRMNTAKDALKGRTVIGCRINTVTVDNSASKREKRNARSTSVGKTKVVHNFGGLIKAVLIIGIIGGLGFTIFIKWNDIVISAKTIMYNIGLYDPAPAQDIARYQEINKKLVSIKNGVYYNEAESLYKEAQYKEAAEMYTKCYGYNDQIDTKIVEANNCYHYSEAERLISTSMVQAYTELNKIKLPFKNIKVNGKSIKDVETLLSQYSRHLDFIGVYGSGDNTFNIKDFAKKNNSLYISESKLGLKKVTTDVDREGYSYMLEEKHGEEVTKWYIASDHVLKVVGDEEKQLRK